MRDVIHCTIANGTYVNLSFEKDGERWYAVDAFGQRYPLNSPLRLNDTMSYEVSVRGFADVLLRVPLADARRIGLVQDEKAVEVAVNSTGSVRDDPRVKKLVATARMARDIEFNQLKGRTSCRKRKTR